MANATSDTHEPVIFDNGTTSMRDLATGEAMHSRIGPWAEAQALHIVPSGLRERLSEGSVSAPLVVWDVGLGIAANALAAIQCARAVSGGSSGAARGLTLLSFERDLSPLRQALEELARFPYLAEFEGPVGELLSSREWRSSEGGCEINWRLFEGDFFSLGLESLPKPDIIFYDFYSPKTAPHLWTYKGFERLFKLSAPGATMCTYSAATWVRSALLLAGFHVGYGPMTDAKMESTVASLSRENLARPLDQRWLDRLGRSGRPWPDDWDGEDGLKRIAEILRPV